MTPDMNKVAWFRERAAEKLDEIAALLVGDPKITLIVRFDGEPEQDILMTVDEIPEIEKLIERRKQPDSIVLPADPAYEINR